jgi:phospholipase/carboxylesterase
MELLYTAHIPAGDGPFPAVVVLHGWGDTAHGLIGFAPILDGGRSIVLCPQGPVAFDTGGGVPGYGWFPMAAGRSPDPAEIQQGLAALQAFLEQALAEYPINRRKVVVLGFSQGGVMAYALALRAPGSYAGLVALSSWLPTAMAETISANPALESLPALVIHGTQDTMISVERARESRDALAQLGVPTRYREYEMGHEINQEALRQLVSWLDEKVMNPVRLA